VGRVARPDPAELHRRPGRHPLLGGHDPARPGQGADGVVPDGHAEPEEPAAVELDPVAAEELAEELVTVEVHDGEPVRPGHLEGVIGRDQAGRPRHVLHDDGGPAGDVLAQVPGDGPRVGVEAAAGREADDDPDRLALEEPRLGRRRPEGGEPGEHGEGAGGAERPSRVSE